MPISRRFVIAQVLERELGRHPQVGPGVLDADEIDALAEAIDDAIARGTGDFVLEEGKRPEELTSDNDG